MSYEAGQILLVSFPFSDLTSGKERPVLVVSSKRYNQGEDFVGLPLSSRIEAGDPFGYPILDSAAYFAQTRLRCSSTVKWTKPMTLSLRVVTRTLGKVPPDVLTEIQSRVQTVFSK